MSRATRTLAAVGLAILFVACVRWRLADVPLERDEGEYAYAGQLILRGIPPYAGAYNMKFPGTYYAYAAILATFGETPRAIHTGLALLNAATVLVLFLLGRRLVGEPAAAVAAVSFALLALDRGVYGAFAHATHFVLLPALGGLLLLLRGLDGERRWALFGAGASIGAAVLMKQHALALVPLVLGLVLWRGPRRQVTFVAAGVLAPLLGTAILLAAQGVWGRFWFWCFRYALEYVTEVPATEAWKVLSLAWTEVTAHSLAWWLMAAAGAVLVWLGRWSAETRVVLTAFAGAMLLAMTPGFYFRPHYFVLLLPSVALFVGVTVVSLARGLARHLSPHVSWAIATVAFLTLAGSYVARERAYYFTMSPRELSRATYGTAPFVEAPTIARYIAERTGPDDLIAVVGSEPEIYFLAGRKSATGHIYTYGLMEPQPYALQMQREMRSEIEASAPQFLVVVQVATSWLMRPESERMIFDWVNNYSLTCFDVVGVADIHSAEDTTFVWGEDAASYRAQAANVIYVLRRKSPEPCSVAS